MTLNNTTELVTTQTKQQPLSVAIVGHTNTGKTSLIRTLLKDVKFGEVCNRPSTTRHVEASPLQINNQHLLTLFDTPGLEDSIGLLHEVQQSALDNSALGIDKVQAFLSSEAAKDEFSQEAKVLRQLLNSDIALYIIDAREPVLGKYQDELTALSFCAKPIMPVLNFIADNDNNKQQWQEHLAKLNLHAVIDFDTVAYSKDNEVSLFQGMQTLLPMRRTDLQHIIKEREVEWNNLSYLAAFTLAELLIDVASYKEKINIDEAHTPVHEHMQNRIRQQENRCIESLLNLYKFYEDEFSHNHLPVKNGKWQQDIFDADTFVDFGLDTGSAMAKGAALGLTIDVFTGGLSLGMGAALGAAAGALFKHGRHLMDAARGFENFVIDDATITLIAMRETQLVFALMRRGHAAQKPINIPDVSKALWNVDEQPKPIKLARRHRNWSNLNRQFRDTTDRQQTIDDLAKIIQNHWKALY